jgi:hypothetical protein
VSVDAQVSAKSGKTNHITKGTSAPPVRDQVHRWVKQDVAGAKRRLQHDVAIYCVQKVMALVRGGHQGESGGRDSAEP